MTWLWLLLAPAALEKKSFTYDLACLRLLFRGTTGLGVHLISEARGKGAVVDRYGEVFLSVTNLGAHSSVSRGVQ